MESGALTIAAIALGLLSLALRWRLPAVSKPIASGLIAIAVVLIASLAWPGPIAWWGYAIALFLAAAVGAALDGLFIDRTWRRDMSDDKERQERLEEERKADGPRLVGLLLDGANGTLKGNRVRGGAIIKGDGHKLDDNDFQA